MQRHLNNFWCLSWRCLSTCLDCKIFWKCDRKRNKEDQFAKKSTTIWSLLTSRKKRSVIQSNQYDLLILVFTVLYLPYSFSFYVLTRKSHFIFLNIQPRSIHLNGKVLFSIASKMRTFAILSFLLKEFLNFVTSQSPNESILFLFHFH